MPVLFPNFLIAGTQGFSGSIVFTYIIIYIALPGYFSPKKNKIFITLITLLLIAAVLIYHYISLYTNFANAVKPGMTNFMPDHWYALCMYGKRASFYFAYGCRFGRGY